MRSFPGRESSTLNDCDRVKITLLTFSEQRIDLEICCRPIDALSPVYVEQRVATQLFSLAISSLLSLSNYIRDVKMKVADQIVN